MQIRHAARRPTLPGLAFAAPLLLLAACQDPSGVGIGLVDEDGGIPGGIVVAMDSVVLGTSGEAQTGGFGTPGSPLQPQSRILVGSVEDALAGAAQAVAYFDVRPPASIPSGFRDRAITSATVRLTRSYLYGDTTATVSLALSEIADDWAPVDLPADTGLVTGPPLVTQNFVVADTLLEIPLPPAWVAENDLDLRSDSASSAIDGFQLRLDGAPALPGVIIGFQASDATNVLSSLRVTTSRDTLDFPVYEVFTSLTRTGDPTPPPDRLLLRSGLNETVRLHFDVGALDTVAVAGAAVQLDVDRSLIDTPGFSRPIATELALLGVREDSSRVLLARARLPDDGDTYTFTSTALSAAVQRAVLGDPEFIRFEAGTPSTPLSLDVLPLIVGPPPLTPTEDRRPRLVVTAIATNP